MQLMGSDGNTYRSWHPNVLWTFHHSQQKLHGRAPSARSRLFQHRLASHASHDCVQRDETHPASHEEHGWPSKDHTPAVGKSLDLFAQRSLWSTAHRAAVELPAWVDP